MTNRICNRSLSAIFALALVGLAGGLTGTAHADRVIDSFTDALPLQSLPGSSWPSPMLWTGSVNGVSQYQDNAAQSGLEAVIGGARYASVSTYYGNNRLISAILANGTLDYATGFSSSGVLELEYGGTSDLNANLQSDGSVAFELDISGDMNAGASPRPIALTIEVASNSGAASAQTTVQLLADGVYQVPFTSFPGINFADVDFLRFTFDASQVSAVDYILTGGLRTTSCLQPAGSALADIFLDKFTTDLPARYLPGYGTVPFMWAGTWNGSSKWLDSAAQSGIAGVIGGQRNTEVQASSINNFITAMMNRYHGTPQLSYDTGYPTSGHLRLEYGAQSDLQANLSQMQAFEFEVDGDMNDGGSPRPVPLTVTVTSSAGSAATQVTVYDDGMYYIPFSQFPGVNFADVDSVEFSFDASAVQAVDFALIGGLRASACVP